MSRRLLVEDGEELATFEILEEVTVIGRDPAATLPISTQLASRRHLSIARSDDELVVEDLGSANGTLLNDEPLTGKRLLAAGDVLEVGGVRLHVDYVRPRPATSSPRLQPKPRSLRAAALIGLLVIVAGALLVFKPGMSASDSKKTRPAGSSAAYDLEPPSTTPGLGVPELRVAEPADVASLLTRVDEALLRDSFRDAMRAIEAHERSFGRRSAASIRSTTEAKMNAAAAARTAEVERFLDAGQAAVAAAKAKEAAGLFPFGSEALRQMDFTLKKAEAAASAVAAASPAVRGAETPSAAVSQSPAEVVAARATALEADRAVIRDMRQDGEAALAERAYDAAAQCFAEALKVAKAAGERSTEIAAIARLESKARRLQTFSRALAEAVDRNPGAFTGVPVLPGRAGQARKSIPAGLVFVIDGNEMEIPWKALRVDAFHALIRAAGFDFDNTLAAAAFLLHSQENKAGHALLRAAEVGADEEHKAAIDAVLAEAAGSDVPAGGFVWHNDGYLSPRDMQRVRDQEAMHLALRDLGSPKAETRADAANLLFKMGDAAAAAFFRGLTHQKSEVLKKLEKNGAWRRLKDLHAHRLEVDKVRSAALDLIFDEQKYPYPYRGRGQEVATLYNETQQEIDRLTGELKRLWGDARRVSLPPDFQSTAAQLAEIDRWLERLDLGEGPETPVFLRHLPAGDAVVITTFAMDADERLRIDTSDEWMRLNDTAPSMATLAERTQVRVTNEYRVMMGRFAVRMDERLQAAARGHSEDMTRLGFFAHENPVDPEKRLPSQRARLAGFSGGGVSENIAMSGSPTQAHNQWLHSSGHHRNILSRSWRMLGAGNSGRNWTQNFAGAVPGETDVSEGTPER